ncbi:MAG: ABC transporter ATP-binding protein [Firmicutes bacterium]|nr:ABC transporter ATP-binding protein [Bacillota bacterium]
MTAADFRERSAFAIFISYFKPHLRLFLLDMSCALLVAAVDLGFPLASRYAMQQLLPERAFRAFFAVVAILVIAYILRSYLLYIISYWGHTFGIRVEADIRRDLFAHLNELSFSFYDRNRTGRLMSRLTTDLFDLTELAHHGPEDLFLATVTIIGALIVMFRVEWRLALIVSLILPLGIFLVVRRRRSMGRVSKEVKNRQAGINAQIESSLSGMRTAKAFANEEDEIGKFNRSNDFYKTSKSSFHKEMGRFNATLEFFTSILTVAVIGAGGYLIMKNRMDYVDLITFSLYVTAFTSPIRKLGNFAETFANGAAGLSRFLEIMRTEPEMRDAPDAVELEQVKGEIRLEDVHFGYKDGEEVLHGVTLTVHPGETLGVVGSSGGGKTTLCQLIPRFYDVTGGRILLDGVDVRQITQRSLRSRIGVVQQDVFLFADSIRENIRYGRPGASDAEVEEAARRAEIYDDVMEMPDGFDTWVGERGVLLSGGQKQRVSIARIFLKDPPLLILDEATSALDSVTEASIQSSFNELARGRTAVVIAHRLSTVQNASRIAVVEDGRILELGPPAELLAQNGEYARLCRSQQLA